MLTANQRVSEHVFYAEIRCGCLRNPSPECDGGHVLARTLDLFERIRAACSMETGRDCPIRISSGVRCPLHNLRVGGRSDSRHLYGEALDLERPADISLERFWEICEREVDTGGLGRYPWGAHVDVCGHPPRRRWSGR